MNKIKVFISALMVFVLVFAPSTVVASGDLLYEVRVFQDEQEDLEQARRERDEALANASAAAARVDQLSSERASLEGELSSLNEENERMQDEYELLASQYSAALLAKAEALNIYVESQEELARTEQLFADRLSVMFEYQNKSPLEILLESDSIAGFFTNIEIITLIADADAQAVEQMEIALDTARIASENALAYANEMEAAANAKLEEIVALEEQIGITTESIANLNYSINEASQQQADFNSRVSELDSRINELQEQIYENNRVGVEDQPEESFESLPSESSPEEGEIPASPVVTGNGQLNWPSWSRYVTSEFGFRWHPVYGDWRGHKGIDISNSLGDSITAAASGTVTYVCNTWGGQNYGGTGYGNYLTIDHGNGIVTLYAHCSDVIVSQGDYVSSGQVIAYVGSTGTSTGAHIHFEVQVNGTAVNPREYLS